MLNWQQCFPVWVQEVVVQQYLGATRLMIADHCLENLNSTMNIQDNFPVQQVGTGECEDASRPACTCKSQSSCVVHPEHNQYVFRSKLYLISS